ncbi:hypothetical protein [Pseudomonas sp. GM80]|uniref:hypothetical protein n=1 Tax=Pseudomonas sp. GM80 TaxID=1144339 RepID=UPI00026F56EB|nr:hypothetical protein [Pseudomonas sp. GM80]EJN36351.1 hypothetical protein PMI37_00133 [Pseudomonas sp. GM80]
MSFFRAAQCFSTAIDILQLPHPNGEVYDIYRALVECNEALGSIDVTQLDAEAAGWIDQLKRLMDYSHLSVPTEKGGLEVKAEQFGITDKIELSQLVKDLYDWCREENRKGL